MNAKLRLILVGGALAASALSAAPAHAADRVIAVAPNFVRPFEAYGGNLVWGADRNFFVRDAAGTRRIPLDRYLTDLDLGARRGGGTQAVFSSCRGGRLSCVLRSYDLRSGRARNLTSLSRPRGSERSPSAWGGRFAFGRERRVQIFRRLRGRTLGLFVTSPLRQVTGAETVATDLRGSRLTYLTWQGPNPFEADLSFGALTLRVATVPRGRSCFVARATYSERGPRALLSDPVLMGDYVYWLRRDRSASTIRRQRLPGRGCRSRGLEERSRELPGIDSFAADRGRFFYTAPDPRPFYSNNWQVREATDPPLTFTR